MGYARKGGAKRNRTAPSTGRRHVGVQNGSKTESSSGGKDRLTGGRLLTRVHPSKTEKYLSKERGRGKGVTCEAYLQVRRTSGKKRGPKDAESPNAVFDVGNMGGTSPRGKKERRHAIYGSLGWGGCKSMGAL